MPAACYVPSIAPRLISCRIRKLTLSPSGYTRSPTHLQTLPSDTSALSSTPPKLCFLAPNCASSTIWCHRKIHEIRRSEVDVTFPQPFPNRWVTGGFGGHCIDAQD